MSRKIHTFFPLVLTSIQETHQMKHEEGKEETKELSADSFMCSGFLPENVVPNFKILMESRPPERGIVKMYGKLLKTPRYTGHYLRGYYYSETFHPAEPLPGCLLPLLNWANEKMSTKVWNLAKDDNIYKFNGVLTNFYMNGEQYIGTHSDDERQLVPNTPILSCSFGETRIFRVRDKNKSVFLDIPTLNTSYVVMCGKMQKEFKHEIVKVTGKRALEMSPRINVTFRVFK